MNPPQSSLPLDLKPGRRGSGQGPRATDIELPGSETRSKTAEDSHTPGAWCAPADALKRTDPLSPILRPVLARSRLAAAQAGLADCRFCAHECRVNRLAGERGRCQAGPTPRVFSAQVEVGDELELIPVYAVAFSGCDLRCDFCITGASSWNPQAGQPWSAQVLAKQATSALAEGARSVMFLGGEPTIHLPAVLEIVAGLPPEARLVWKTNAHVSAQARPWLEGLFDVWLADLKFGQDACAERLAGIRGYSEVVRENLVWARDQSELIVRHLLMPGHVDCCWRPVAEWLATVMPAVKVSLRTGFWPGWHAARHPELARPIAEPESRRAWAIAQELRLHLIP